MSENGDRGVPPEHPYIEQVKRLHVEHLRRCERCNDADGLFCDIARLRASTIATLTAEADRG